MAQASGGLEFGPIPIEYAGQAPGLVPGVKQVNLLLPENFVAPPANSSFWRLYVSNGTAYSDQLVQIQSTVAPTPPPR